MDPRARSSFVAVNWVPWSEMKSRGRPYLRRERAKSRTKSSAVGSLAKAARARGMGENSSRTGDLLGSSKPEPVHGLDEVADHVGVTAHGRDGLEKRADGLLLAVSSAESARSFFNWRTRQRW